MPLQESGRLHGFQFWINLPAREKMKPASYRDIQEPDEIPNEGPRWAVRMIAGAFDGGDSDPGAPGAGSRLSTARCSSTSGWMPVPGSPASTPAGPQQRLLYPTRAACRSITDQMPSRCPPGRPACCRTAKGSVSRPAPTARRYCPPPSPLALPGGAYGPLRDERGKISRPSTTTGRHPEPETFWLRRNARIHRSGSDLPTFENHAYSDPGITQLSICSPPPGVDSPPPKARGNRPRGRPVTLPAQRKPRSTPGPPSGR